MIKNNQSKVMKFIETKVFFDRSKLENIKLSWYNSYLHKTNLIFYVGKTEVKARLELLQELLMQESIEIILKIIQVSCERCFVLSKPDEK